MLPNARRNGMGSTVPDADAVIDDTPPGTVVPMPRGANPPAFRREFVIGVVGFGIGVALTLAILNFCSRRSR